MTGPMILPLSEILVRKIWRHATASLSLARRGFGNTTFKDDDVACSGSSGILTMDAIELMNSLSLNFSVIGHVPGANVAKVLAVG